MDCIMAAMSPAIWYKVEQLPWPADWAALFGRAAPLVMEIGFGSGLFLADWARRRPEVNLLGVEISIPALRRAGRKLEQSGLNNVRLMQADAAAVLRALCLPADLAAVVINFPDPWPKKDHDARRLIDDPFLCLLASRLAAGGALDIATDHDEYAEQIAACLARSPHFESRAGAPFTLSDPGRVTTKYEQVALSEGRTPRYFPWRRNAAPVVESFPTPQEVAMPHVVLRGPVDLDEIGRRFRPTVSEFDGGLVRFIEAYRSLADGKLLIETYINEDPIRQRLGLELRPRANGELVVGLAEVGFPRPTRGVHVAVGRLAAWLRAEFPALIVVSSALQESHAGPTR
jgi:tRNA (guanine-N7-)-methyltransferase